MKDMESIGGLDISVENGKLKGEEDKDAKDFSSNARSYLTGIMDDQMSDITVYRADPKSKNPYQRGTHTEEGVNIYINPDQIENSIYSMGKGGFSEIASGFGFAFIHESLHTLSGTRQFNKGAIVSFKDPNSLYGEKDERKPGDVEYYVNKFRMDMKLPTRSTYFINIGKTGYEIDWLDVNGKTIKVTQQEMPQDERDKRRKKVKVENPEKSSN